MALGVYSISSPLSDFIDRLIEIESKNKQIDVNVIVALLVEIKMTRHLWIRITDPGIQ